MSSEVLSNSENRQEKEIPPNCYSFQGLVLEEAAGVLSSHFIVMSGPKRGLPLRIALSTMYVALGSDWCTLRTCCGNASGWSIPGPPASWAGIHVPWITGRVIWLQRFSSSPQIPTLLETKPPGLTCPAWDNWAASTVGLVLSSLAASHIAKSTRLVV